MELIFKSRFIPSPDCWNFNFNPIKFLLIGRCQYFANELGLQDSTYGQVYAVFLSFFFPPSLSDASFLPPCFLISFLHLIWTFFFPSLLTVSFIFYRLNALFPT